MQKQLREQEGRHIYLAQAVMNSLLRFSLENITLDGFLKCALSVILSTPPFSITSKGAIYIIEDDPDILIMKAQSKLPKSLENEFKQIAFIKHPYGKVASGGRVKFEEKISGDYKLKNSQFKSYAYYCLPLIYSGKILGIMDVFLKKGHKWLKREEEFLIAAANTVAGVVQRKKFEQQLRNTQNSLAYSEKLSALGRFASGIAHEVKNPLGIILGGVEFLDKKLVSADKEVRITIDKIKKSTFRADSILHNLLKFAMPSQMKKKRVRPQELINETLSLIKYRASLVDIKITVDCPRKDIFIEADPGQIEQVLFNLIMNAVEAIAGGGRIKIKVRKGSQEELTRGQDCCTIEVSDSGEGIVEGNFSRLFEPFFTTKASKKGTGLGLFISRMIVEAHQGSLSVKSKVKSGTVVRMVLPAVE